VNEAEARQACADDADGGDEATGLFAFKARGFVSNANYNAKKPCLILFINDRLVESLAVRRTLESVYKDVLPNHTHPFIYLSITLPSRHVDVNVHPTKREVPAPLVRRRAVTAALPRAAGPLHARRSAAREPLLRSPGDPSLRKRVAHVLLPNHPDPFGHRPASAREADRTAERCCCGARVKQTPLIERGGGGAVGGAVGGRRQ
jgi:hypothetical protein